MQLPPGKSAWLSVQEGKAALALNPNLAFGFTRQQRPYRSQTETKGYARAFRRAADSLPRYRSGSAASCPALRRCAPVARFQQWSRPSLMAESYQWHSRSHPKYPSPPGALLPSSPVYPQDNAQRSCSPWPPIHGRRIRWRVNACSCSR
jgi:hypothetical protein